VEWEAHFIELPVDRPEIAGVHLAVTGASGFDRRLVHGFDAAGADRGELGLVDRGEQSDDSLGDLGQLGPTDPDATGAQALMLAIQGNVPSEFIHQQPGGEADIRAAAFQHPSRGR
jgi:hypothetical protein